MVETIQSWLVDHGIKIAITLVAAYILIRVLSHFIEKAIRRIVKDQPQMSAGAERKREDTLIRIVNGILKVAVWIFALMMVLSELGMDIGPLIAGAGIIGIAFGFGGQYLVKDLISGLFIILENQYRIGDGVEIAGLAGKVEDINLRVTVLRDLDGIVHHVPHGEITTVSNKSMGASKINLDFGIGYGDDIDKAIAVINRVGEEMKADKELGSKLREAPHFLRVNDLADSSVVLKIVALTEPGEQFTLMGELRKRLKEACDKEGIEIPFPQMVVHKSGE